MKSFGCVDERFLLLLVYCGVESLGQTLDSQRGATLFNRACIGCHDTGGNIIQPVSLINS